MFVGHDPDGVMKGATILPPGRIDRSPCGTGNSARLAVMEARGQVEVGQSLKAAFKTSLLKPRKLLSSQLLMLLLKLSSVS